MTGSLQIKNGYYYAVLNLYENGKRKQKWIPTGLPTKGNKRKADRFLTDTIREHEHLEIKDSSIPFSMWIRKWLEGKKATIDEVTYQGYLINAISRVLPYFDELGICLNEVTKEVLQNFFNNQISIGRLDGKGPIKAASLKQYKNIINQALNEAVREGLIPSNPCQFVELPKIEKYKSKVYNGAQIKRLLEVTKDDPLAPLILITALFGLRRSEVLGIKWDSIDIESKRLTIKHTVSKVSKAVEKDKTKNASSYRSFILTDEVIQIFRELKTQEENNKSFFGKGYHDSDYVFKWPDGKPFTPDYVTSHFSDLLKKNNLPPIRFHELRHSCASLLLNQGRTLKDVQEYMGHADIQITADIYGHLDIGRKDMLTKGIQSAIFS